MFRLGPELSQYLEPEEMAQAEGYVIHRLLAVVAARRLQRLREITEHSEDDIEDEEWEMTFKLEGKEMDSLQWALQALLKSPAA